MSRYERIFLIVLDSDGIGELPDAKHYGDEGANTLGNIAKKLNGLHMPQLEKFGLGNIAPIKGVEKVSTPTAFYTKMAEASIGKDTMTGHWELMSIRIENPFETFHNGYMYTLIIKI